MKSSQYFVRDNQKEKSSARGFPRHLHQGDQRSPETIFITMGTGGHTGLASHACPRHCVQRKEERHHYPLCLTRNRLGDPVEGIIKVICLRHIEEFLKKKRLCKIVKAGKNQIANSASQAALWYFLVTLLVTLEILSVWI